MPDAAVRGDCTSLSSGNRSLPDRDANGVPSLLRGAGPKFASSSWAMKLQRIVVGTDFSDLGTVAVTAALSLARRFNAGVHVVHVVDAQRSRSMHPYVHLAGAEPLEAQQAQEDAARARLSTIVSDHVEITREVCLGIPARNLREAARRAQADLIVIASHGYGAVKAAILGSVASSLIRTSEIPVLVVGAERHSLDMMNVVVGVDLSPVTDAVLKHAVRMASPGGHLTVVTAYEPPVLAGPQSAGKFAGEKEQRGAEEERIRAVRQRFPGKMEDVTWKIEALSKAPASMAILESAEILNADLIVIGTSGHNAWHRFFLGSTANRVLSLAECPVLVVPTAADDSAAPADWGGWPRR